MTKIILTDCDGVLLDWEFGFTDWMRRKGYHLSENYLGNYPIQERYDELTKSGAKTLVREFNNSAEMLSLSPLHSSMKYIMYLLNIQFLVVAMIKTELLNLIEIRVVIG